MKNLYSYLLLFVAVIFAPTVVKAQYQTVFPFLTGVSQSSYLMPTNTPQSTVVIGLPAISNFYLGFLNDGPKYNDFISGKIIDLNKIPGAVKERGAYYGFENQVDLLHIRFQTRKMFWGLSSSINTQINARVPKDLFDVAINGNASFVNANKKADFSKLAFDGQAYQDYSLSFASPLGNFWKIGGRVRYLKGFASAQTKRSNGSLSTSDPDNYSQAIGTDYLFNTSTGGFDTDNSNNNSLSKILNSKGNSGLGLDISGRYEHSTRWSFFGSLIDLGYINWKTGVKNFQGKLTTTYFNGFSVNDIQDSSNNFKFNGVGDTLKNRFKSVQTKNSYQTTLVPKFYVGSTYKLNDRGALNMGVLTKSYKGLHPALILNATQGFGRRFQLSFSYSASAGSYANLGAGIMMMPGPVQIYFAADNLVGLAALGTVTNTTARFGINFVFGGGKPRDRDEDGVPDKNDDCPDEPGKTLLKGCPDTDGDGVPNKDDLCPTVFGLVPLQGCPDADGDGIKDSEDMCPKVAGPASCKGCPDLDKDGITDAEDACPTKPGKLENQGCPDTDGDGLFDNKDKCPDEAGKPEDNGCPLMDRDKDGVYDKDDKCPDVAGLVSTAGCPDTDHDGVFDDTDKCIDVFGPADNFGCPYPDTDKDGVLDRVDSCINEPGPVENKGCPDVDTDSDGLVDRLDECPKTPGPVANGGCPELKKEEKVVVKTAFSNLEFELNKDIIKKSSYPGLGELAKLLQNNSQYRLKLSGHTDIVGTEAFNLALSKKRANAVKNFMIKQGVDPGRILIEAFGSKKPIASNKTPQGRAKNRRVEMKVLFE